MPNHTRTLALFAAAIIVTQACGREAGDDRTVETRTEDGTLAAMSADSADERGVALVRVVNAVPMSREMMIRADEMHVLPAVKFRGVSAYQPIDKTWASFQIGDTVAGTFVPLNTNRELLTNGDRYSLIVLKNQEGTNFETLVVRDQLVQEPGKAAIRVVNAAPGLREVIVQPRNAERLVEGLDYGEEASYRTIDPWSGVLEIRADNRNESLITTPKMTFEAGKAYTLVISRTPQGKVDLFWFADSPMG